MSVPSWLQTAEASALGASVRESTYLFPAIEVVHLVGITLVLAAVVVTHLRRFGVFASLGELRAAARGVFFAGLALALLSGAVLFVTEAAKCFSSDAFRWKVTLLALAIGVETAAWRIDARPVAAVALLLWFGVGAAGRFIGFS